MTIPDPDRRIPENAHLRAIMDSVDIITAEYRAMARLYIAEKLENQRLRDLFVVATCVVPPAGFMERGAIHAMAYGDDPIAGNQ